MVLAVSVVQELQPEDELWLAFETGRSFRYLAAHDIAAGLGREKARALPMYLTVHIVLHCTFPLIFLCSALFIGDNEGGHISFAT